MPRLIGKTMVVIGGSRGVGRQIVRAGVDNGARVLPVARQADALEQLTRERVAVLSLDATDEDAPDKVFDALEPDILVVCAGAFPPAARFSEQSWREFAVNWETDVKIAFLFCKAALLRPLRASASVILISSGAALAGSPIRGGMPEPSGHRSATGKHVLGHGQVANDVDGRLERGDRLQRAKHGSCAAHVGLHRLHRLRRLEREPTGVERDALAGEDDGLGRLRVAVGQPDHSSR